MTKQDLIENNIFLPEVIDDQIKARFLLGDWILLSNFEGRFFLLKMSNDSRFKSESNILSFRLLGSRGWSDLNRKDYSIKRSDYVRQIWYRNRPSGCITWYLYPDDIDRVIKRLSYD